MDHQSIRSLLGRKTIYLDVLHTRTGTFDHVDAFINLSRGNESVEKVSFRLATDSSDDVSGTHDRYDIWDKIAEGVGNFQVLREITIDDYFLFGEHDLFVPDWEILARILPRLRKGIQLRMRDHAPLLWDTETLPTFAGIIRGQAMITGFSTGAAFAFDCLDILCSALLTLPALEIVSFEQRAGQGPEEGQSLESMVKLLQSPTLREVRFQSVAFTNTLSQAVAMALKERSEVTLLRFDGCSFPNGGGTAMACALATNAKLKCLEFVHSELDKDFYELLAAALLSNSTLQKLAFAAPYGQCAWLSLLLMALQRNTGLKQLRISYIEVIDEKLSTAMRIGLGSNSTLELLELANIESSSNDTSLWLEALSFLRTNATLKSLHMSFEWNVTESHAAAIRMQLPAALRENESLETLSMIFKNTRLEDYLELLGTIQPNTTLKSLRLHPLHGVDEDETKDLIPVLKKNYGLEELPGLDHHAGDIRSIFELNRAGRRYLVEDGSSIAKGIDVLIGVSNNTNSVFLHLLENPRLCDRSAVEMLGSRISDNGVTVVVESDISID
jgi:hypothetical protein